MRAADDAGAPGVARQRRQADRVLARAALQAQLVEILGRDAGQNRDGEDVRRRDAQLGGALGRRVDGRPHHLVSAERVHVDDVGRSGGRAARTAASTVRGMSCSLASTNVRTSRASQYEKIRSGYP